MESPKDHINLCPIVWKSIIFKNNPELNLKSKKKRHLIISNKFKYYYQLHNKHLCSMIPLTFQPWLLIKIWSRCLPQKKNKIMCLNTVIKDIIQMPAKNKKRFLNFNTFCYFQKKGYMFKRYRASRLNKAKTDRQLRRLIINIINAHNWNN